MSLNGNDFDARGVVNLRVSPEPTDPLQLRWSQIGREIAELRKERERLRIQMQNGICEVCGTAFKRVRATKAVCGQKCATQKSMLHRANGAYDVLLLREMLPLLEVSGQFKPRVLDIIRMVIIEGRAANQTGDYFHLAHQRISQILQRATGVARLMKQMQMMIRAEAVAAAAKKEPA